MNLPDSFSYAYSPTEMAEAEGYKIHALLAATVARKLQIIRETEVCRKLIYLETVDDDQYDDQVLKLKELREEMRDLKDVSMNLSSLLKSPGA